jgi:hypothetical protein
MSPAAAAERYASTSCGSEMLRAAQAGASELRPAQARSDGRGGGARHAPHGVPRCTAGQNAGSWAPARGRRAPSQECGLFSDADQDARAAVLPGTAHALLVLCGELCRAQRPELVGRPCVRVRSFARWSEPSHINLRLQAKRTTGGLAPSSGHASRPHTMHTAAPRPSCLEGSPCSRSPPAGRVPRGGALRRTGTKWPPRTCSQRSRSVLIRGGRLKECMRRPDTDAAESDPALRAAPRDRERLKGLRV